MRRLAVALLTLGLAGCGGGEARLEPAAAPLPTGDFGPAKAQPVALPRPVAPPLHRPGAAVAAALAAGTTGVVGAEGDVAVRPVRLIVASDGELTGLRWSRWSAGAAEASGRLRLRECDPNCAGGTIRELPAAVRLSRPRVCGRATYFDRARVTVTGAPAPASYVRAPC
jgi:hypothetical protein